MGLFSAVEMASHDPILSLNETFNAGTHPGKINLGTDVYYNEEGRIPLLRAVQTTEKVCIEAHASRGHLPIEGIIVYDQGVQKLLFDNGSELLAVGHVVTTQAVGGIGTLKLGVDFLRHLLPDATVVISNPSWENHRALFEAADSPVQNYRYYDATSDGMNHADLLEDLNAPPIRLIVVLHACCHNPTGADLELDDWRQVLDVLRAKGHVSFLDITYRGFNSGIEEDAAAVHLFAQSDLNFFVSNSFSRSFSLCGERVGALSIVTESRNESACILSQMKRVIRTNHSNSLAYGTSVVSSVLNSSELRALWEQGLDEIRDRIHDMRLAMVEQSAVHDAKCDSGFAGRQRGMFSYSGLIADQVERLKTEFGIYTVSTGRIYVAALNKSNLGTITKAIV